MIAEKKTIYLDHNATAPVHPQVLEELTELVRTTYGNPSAPYQAGQEAKGVVRKAREQVAELIGAEKNQIIFTSGGTESNNLAIKSAFSAAGSPNHGHLVISSVEHPSVFEVANWLAAQGVEVTLVPVNRQGQVSVAEVSAALTKDTFLVAIMHANNETGVIQPVAEIGTQLQDRGIWFHVDGVQAVGKIPVEVSCLACDSYSLSGHKFGGLKGSGALYMHRRERGSWLLQGGHQEGGLRAGTENVPGIFAMGRAAVLAHQDLADNMRTSLETRKIFEGLLQAVPMSRLNGHPDCRLPNTLNICFLYADAMSLCVSLSLKGIYVGTGSACASHTKEPSRILRAMGLSDLAAYTSIRISTGQFTSAEDAHAAAHEIAEAVERIRLVTAPESIGECGDDCPCFTDE